MLLQKNVEHTLIPYRCTGAVTQSAVKEGRNCIVCTNTKEDFGNITELAFGLKSSYDGSE